MKVSVITQHTVNNYGSVLQTYATSEVLKRLGHEAEFVDFCRRSNLDEVRAERLLETNSKLQKLKPIWNLCGASRKAARKLVSWNLARNQQNMRRFLRETVTFTDRRYTSFEELRQDPPAADAYVTGSDQVWNSQHNDGIQRAYYLDYAPAGKKRIAFAASIGKTRWEPWEIPETKALLEQYNAISVRETGAVLLLKELGIDARAILDPTLVLTGDDWRKLANHEKCPAKPYLLIYQLNRDREMDAYAEKVAQKMGWEIVRIGYHHSDKRRVGTCVFCPTVPRFLGLFDRAACCLTDSFHATAFSLNLGIDVLSVRPPRFATRIDSILALTGTENRLVSDYGDLSPVEAPVDKEAVAAILDAQRAAAMDFLRQALEE